MQTFLDFEKPIADLEGKIEELRHITDDGDLNIQEEISRLESRVEKLIKATYDRLTPQQKVQVARHPARPHALSYISALIDDFTPLAGDRLYGEDAAILGGLGRFRGRTVVVLGTEKGDDTPSRVHRNFGAAKPEGYRKARRLIEMADRFGVPLLTFIDTAGAYPGVASEERGQAEAIAKAIEACLAARTPIVAVVIGEGGSGGAVAIATADRVLMLEHAIYSVISPEGCSSILWRNSNESGAAAQALRLTAQDLSELGVIDEIVTEPVGGAHRSRQDSIDSVGDALADALAELDGVDGGRLRVQRRSRFLKMGQLVEE